MNTPLYWLRAVPYTIAVSAVVGVLLAPMIITGWSSLLDTYDKLHPVVKLSARVISRDDQKIIMHLRGQKLRDCELIGLAMYGTDEHGVLHHVHKQRADGEQEHSRPVGVHDFGIWYIWPSNWDQIVIQTRHQCSGRVVVTKALEVEIPSIAASKPTAH